MNPFTPAPEGREPLLIVAVDIERSGCKTCHRMVSIGYCAGLPNGTIINKGKINLKVNWPARVEGNFVEPFNDFEPRCIYTHWAKQSAATIEMVTKDAVDQKTGFKTFAELLDNWDDHYKKVVFVTDNAGFDIRHLDNGLEEYVGRMPLTYSKYNWEYRSVKAYDDMIDTLPPLIQASVYEIAKSRGAKHDHDPENDAHYHYECYIALCMYIDKAKDVMSRLRQDAVSVA